MVDQKLRLDFEGDFYRVSPAKGKPHLAKVLSLETAWPVDDMFSLQFSHAPLVQLVDQDLTQGILSIHYAPEVQLLDLSALREILHLGGVFAGWRVARFGLALARSLAVCHSAGLPQMVVHPERIALFKGDFVLLPSLAAILLPPFPSLLSRPNPWWLQFIAPEVLRTRGNVRDLLEKGDVYALGKTLMAVLDSAWSPVYAEDVFNAVEDSIERPIPIQPQGLTFAPAKFTALLCRATALYPQNRPSLHVLVSEFEQIVSESNPASQIRAMLASAADLNAAQQGLDELKVDRANQIYTLPEKQILSFSADMALAQSPPAFSQAIGHLERIRSLDSGDGEVWLKIARLYVRFTEHEQHFLLASEAYLEALNRLGWKEDLVQEWSAILPSLPPAVVSDATALVPYELRTQAIYAWRAANLEQIGLHDLAWQECATCLERFGFDQRIFDIAGEVAGSIPPLELLAWKARNEGKLALMPLVSIVWSCNGNDNMALQCWPYRDH